MKLGLKKYLEEEDGRRSRPTFCQSISRCLWSSCAGKLWQLVSAMCLLRIAIGRMFRRQWSPERPPWLHSGCPDMQSLGSQRSQNAPPPTVDSSQNRVVKGMTGHTHKHAVQKLRYPLPLNEFPFFSNCGLAKCLYKIGYHRSPHN